MRHFSYIVLIQYRKLFKGLTLFLFLLFSVVSASAQQITVHGVVTGNGNVLPGVTVRVSKTSGTVTDAQGQYNLEVPSLQDTLEFSFIGYKTKKVAIKGRNKVNIVMDLKAVESGEVVVTAFGVKKKAENLVGAVTTIDPTVLAKFPSSNLTAALAGRAPGLISFQRSGEPGKDNANFFIRGVSTFGYRTSPLILIDGVESTVTDLARLQADNIENFSILKDATATAVYGSRAANGVILIETKVGQEGKPHIGLRMATAVSMPTRNIKFADPVEYMKLYNKAVLGRDPFDVTAFSQQKIDKTVEGANPYLYPAVNWIDALFKKYTVTERFNLNVSGGGHVVTYYVSGGFDRDNGLLKVDPINNYNNNIDLKSYSLRANVNIHLSKNTQLISKLGGHFDDYIGPLNSGAEIYQKAVSTSPVSFPAYYPRSLGYSYVNHTLFGSNFLNQNGSDALMDNPYADMVKGYQNYSRSSFNIQFGIIHEFAFLKGLKFSATAFIQRYSFFSVQRSIVPFFYHASSLNEKTNALNLVLLNPAEGNATLNYNPTEKDVQTSFKGRANLNYQHTFSKKSSINGMLVFLMQSQLIGNPEDLLASLPQRNLGISGEFSYNYANRYNINVNFGYNGAERFAKNHRFGFFPSIGLAWNASNEDFWRPLKNIVSTLRFRATYGLVGNSEIGSPSDRFLYLSNVNLRDNSRGYTFGLKSDHSLPGMSISRYANNSITWEKAKKIDLGVEIGLYNYLTLKADFYSQKRFNILEQRNTIPVALGLSAIPLTNYGRAINKGFEVSLTYKQFLSHDVSLQVQGDLTYARNKYTQFSEPEYKNTPWLSHVGRSMSQPYGLVAVRLFVDSNEVANSPTQEYGQYTGGDIKYFDVNGDGIISNLDIVPIGKYPTVPEINYGFGFSFGYKNFDLSTFVEGLAHESFFIDAEATAPFLNNHQLMEVYAQSHWSEDNQDLYATFPRFSALNNKGSNNNYQPSTWWLRNGSFLRVKALEIGYSLPSGFLNSHSLQKLRIYLNTTNPFTFSKFKLWDPEMGGNGLGYPIQKVYNIGVKVDF